MPTRSAIPLSKHQLFSIVVGLFATASSFCAAQPRGLTEDVSELFSYGDDYFLEVAVMPGEDSVRSRCVVLFRFTYDLLNFKRAASLLLPSEQYVATPSLFVDAIDSDGVIDGRGLWRDTAWADGFEETNARSRFITGAVSLMLKPGHHTIRYAFDNGEPGSGFSRETEPFTMVNPRSMQPTVCRPLFLRNDDRDTLRLLAMDGNAAFGASLRCFVPFGGAHPPQTASFRLMQVLPGRAGMLEIRTGTIDGIAARVDGPPRPAGDHLDLPLYPPSGTEPRSFGGFVDANLDEAPPGDYAMIISATNPAGSVVDTFRFALKWMDAPFTLSSVSYAIRALYPIATDSAIDRMSSGDTQQQTDALNRFWAERDPTPTTRYNEAMAEYYRRADYAFFNFRTIDRRDGVMTDRGQVFMLNGPPTDVRRVLEPSTAAKEIWTYENRVGMIFVFSDREHNGDFRLVEYRPIKTSD